MTILMTLRKCSIVGYLPYETFFMSEILHSIEPRDREWDELDTLWRKAAMKVDDQEQSLIARANDNKVALVVITESGNKFYLTSYDGDYFIHLGYTRRKMHYMKGVEIIDVIPSIFIKN
jgi:hypothetical protein